MIIIIITITSTRIGSLVFVSSGIPVREWLLVHERFVHERNSDQMAVDQDNINVGIATILKQ